MEEEWQILCQENLLLLSENTSLLSLLINVKSFALKRNNLSYLRSSPRWFTHGKGKGNIHFHFGAIHLAFSCNGRKCLLVVAKIALLDSWYMSYQHASIGTLQTTLNARMVFFTLFSNFNMSLNSSYLSTVLKVQVHISEATMVSNDLKAILYYQIIFRIQNHSLDIISLPKFLISIDS